MRLRTAAVRMIVRPFVFLAIAAPQALAAPAGPSAGDRLATVTAVQNTVETKPSAEPAWSASFLGQVLAANDRIRTGPASRAAIRYSDQTLQRINEKSEVEILPPAGGESGVVKLLTGKSYFTTRTPKDFGRVQTRTVTAAIKGTEFAVDVSDEGTTLITMIEGVVEASNEFGSVTAGGGEQVVVEPGGAPQRRVAVRARDAVAWSLYYPAVVGGSDRERLESAGSAGERLTRAASALANGQIDVARRLLDEAADESRHPVALALASVLALVVDRRDEARATAEAAIAADGSSASALLARSFVAQADFDLALARGLTEKAASLDPGNVEALARAAELRLATGDPTGARSAAEEAVRRRPDHGRALAVLGFIELAAYRTREAATDFDRAIRADPGLPIAHAGRGIALIRSGDVVGGREELQTAATLDPADASFRSYLGKAYYEEKRHVEASRELAAAKDLDPMDPTPWLYSAILLQNENRPVEALRDLNAAIERNDNRAVYRSRLLLDEDRAVRGADLARIYDDLGFNALALVTARRSADENQANFSSHLLLAGNYRNAPGFASSFLSETLQARIYQPVGANAARPEQQGGAVGFNEYTALFDRPRLRGFLGATYGETDTDLQSLFPGCGAPCADFFEIDESRGWTGNLQATLNADRVAASIGVRHLDDDGFRRNNRQKGTVATAFAQFAPSERDTVQFSQILARRETGDLPLRQLPVLPTPEAFTTDEWNLGLGWHRRLSPELDLAVSGTWNETNQTGTLLESGSFEPTSLSARARLEGPQLEGQVVWRPTRRLTLVAGAGAFDGTLVLRATSRPETEGDESFSSAYGYLKVRGLGPIEIAAGLAVERIDWPVGLLPPRDSRLPISDLTFEDSQVSPKLGITATFASGTTVRASVFSRLAASIGRLQTLEPTQVSGFNQFYEDVGGTRSWNYGVGFDQALGDTVFFGASWLHRNSDIPEAFCADPNPFSNCDHPDPGDPLYTGPPVVVERESRDALASAYFNVLIGRRVAGAIEWYLDERDFDTTTLSPIGSFQDFTKTERYRPQIRVFLPGGFYGSAAGNYYTQRVDQFEDRTDPARRVERARFWTLDAAVGWRLPGRIGSISLEGTNLTDREFGFYERSIQDTVVPARRVALRADFAF